MAGPSTSHSNRPRQHEQSTNRTRAPTKSLERDLPPESLLLIESSDRLLDRDQLRLDLNHERHRARSMNGEDIDRTTLAVYGIGHLDRDLLPQSVEEPRCLRGQVGVVFVEQPVQVRPSPPRSKVKANLEARQDRAQRIHGECAEQSALES
jgi:hypothetical protein